jgi:hypothetical protein
MDGFMRYHAMDYNKIGTKSSLFGAKNKRISLEP